MLIDPRLADALGPPRADRRLRLGVFVGATLLIAYSILFRGLNHDEGQYVAAIALMRTGWPYLDFAYLQTPLQPLLLSPLALVPAGWLLVAARCANGLFALVALGLLYSILERRAGLRNTLIAMAALGCTESFVLASAYARNDALPMMLSTGAIFALLRAVDRKDNRAALAVSGLLLGLAISAKINFAVPAAGAGVFLLLRGRAFGARGILLFAFGALAGLSPTIVLAAIAPKPFRFDVFTYNLEAPLQWWSAVGRSDKFTPAHRILKLVGLAAQGAILPALAGVAIDRRRSDSRLLLDLMVIGGLAGAYMPEPSYSQYLVPLLPPLFARFGLALVRPRQRGIKPVLVLTAIGSIVGLVGAIFGIGMNPRDIQLVRAVREGRQVARLAAGGSIATLSPEVAAGADTNLARGFVTGPFLFRTDGELSGEALRLGYSPNWRRIHAALSARPPALIQIGWESTPRPPIFPKGADAELEDWAKTNPYTRITLSDQSVVFVRRR